jgi:predicted small lipoprotein YifL
MGAAHDRRLCAATPGGTVSRSLLCVLLLALVTLAGCGLHDPYAQRREPPAAVPPAAAAPSVEGVVASAAEGRATDALARFATTWVNWSGASLARQRAELLTLAAGPLRDELRTDAAEVTRARLQEVSNAYSRGRFVGAIPQAGRATIVITYEEVAALGGQAQAAYHVYLARTARTPNGLRITQWEPVTDS